MLTKEQADFLDMQYRKNYLFLHSYAKKILNSKSISEEAVQETFKIACDKINIFYASNNPEGWLVKTLKNVIKNIFKVQRSLNKYIIQVPDIEDIKTSTDFTITDYELIFGDIAKSDDFKLLTRIVIDKHSMLEASMEFNITVEACKKRVQRIKKKLKTVIKGNNIFLLCPFLLLCIHI